MTGDARKKVFYFKPVSICRQRNTSAFNISGSTTQNCAFKVTELEVRREQPDPKDTHHTAPHANAETPLLWSEVQARKCLGWEAPSRPAHHKPLLLGPAPQLPTDPETHFPGPGSGFLERFLVFLVRTCMLIALGLRPPYPEPRIPETLQNPHPPALIAGVLPGPDPRRIQVK